MKSSIVAICIALVCVTTQSYAYSINQTLGGYTVRWESVPITYYVNPAGSDNISNGSDIAAIQSAFSDWQSVNCSKLSFQSLGSTSVKQVMGVGNGEPNGKNEIIWIENADWTFGQYTLAVTIPSIEWNGKIKEADIAFNGYSSKWSTSGKFGKSDVKSVAVHEIGHMFGLQHVLGGYPPSNPPTMAPKVDPYGKTASIESDDKQGACFLYPKDGKFICGSTNDCPYVVEKDPNTGKESYVSQLQCKGLVCQYDDSGKPQLDFGEPCKQADDCKSPFFCQPVNAQESFCSYECDPNANNCPAGYACYPYEDGSGGACIAKNVAAGLANGQPCEHNLDCQSSNCYPVASGQWECWDPCQKDIDCAGSAKCFHAPGFVDGACLPPELLPNSKVQEGDPCNANDDCESGICIVNPNSAGPQFCRTPCALGTDSCSFGFECVSVPQGGGACLPAQTTPQQSNLGEPCESPSDCMSGLCWAGLCRQPCTVGASGCQPVDQVTCQRMNVDDLTGYCGARGPNPVGANCVNDSDCQSLFCALDSNNVAVCKTPCVLGGTPCVDVTQNCVSDGGSLQVGVCQSNGAATGAEPTSDGGTGTVTGTGTASGMGTAGTGMGTVTGIGSGTSTGIDSSSTQPGVTALPPPSNTNVGGCSSSPQSEPSASILFVLLLLFLATRGRCETT